jgi:hypothetical protein
MIRLLKLAAPTLIAIALAAPGFAKEPAKDKAEAKTSAKSAQAKSTSAKTTTAKTAKADKSAKGDATDKADGGKTDKGKADKGKKGAAGKPTPVGRFGEWDVFNATGKSKTCYTLARPKDRAPASLKRDDAYVFISNRPGENVRNEVSVIMGFTMKDNSEPKADVGGTVFDLVAKGANAWLKNPAEEGQFIDALKKGSKLVVRASSVKGNASTDSYSLAGFSDALARIHKDCP